MRAGREPLPVSLERQSKQVVGNAHIAVRAVRYRFRRDGLHLLRHHADIRGVAAVVDEAIIAEAVVEPPEQHDIVLEANVGATPAAASAAGSPATSAHPAAAPAHPAAAAKAAGPAHPAATHRAAVGERGVGPAHPDAAHRRTARPRSGPRRRPGGRTVRGPRSRLTAARTVRRPCCRPIGRLTAARTARTADAAGSPGAARPTGPPGTSRASNPARPAGPPRAANAADAAGTARSAHATDAPWPAGSADTAGTVGADPGF